MYQKSLNMNSPSFAKEDLSDYHFVPTRVLSNEIDRAEAKNLLDKRHGIRKRLQTKSAYRV